MVNDLSLRNKTIDTSASVAVGRLSELKRGQGTYRRVELPASGQDTVSFHSIRFGAGPASTDKQKNTPEKPLQWHRSPGVVMAGSVLGGVLGGGLLGAILSGGALEAILATGVLAGAGAAGLLSLFRRKTADVQKVDAIAPLASATHRSSVEPRPGVNPFTSRTPSSASDTDWEKVDRAKASSVHFSGALSSLEAAPAHVENAPASLSPSAPKGHVAADALQTSQAYLKKVIFSAALQNALPNSAQAPVVRLAPSYESAKNQVQTPFQKKVTFGSFVIPAVIPALAPSVSEVSASPVESALSITAPASAAETVTDANVSAAKSGFQKAGLRFQGEQANRFVTRQPERLTHAIPVHNLGNKPVAVVTLDDQGAELLAIEPGKAEPTHMKRPLAFVDASPEGEPVGLATDGMPSQAEAVLQEFKARLAELGLMAPDAQGQVKVVASMGTKGTNEPSKVRNLGKQLSEKIGVPVDVLEPDSLQDAAYRYSSALRGQPSANRHQKNLLFGFNQDKTTLAFGKGRTLDPQLTQQHGQFGVGLSDLSLDNPLDPIEVSLAREEVKKKLQPHLNDSVREAVANRTAFLSPNRLYNQLADIEANQAGGADILKDGLDIQTINKYLSPEGLAILKQHILEQSQESETHAAP